MISIILQHFVVNGLDVTGDGFGRLEYAWRCEDMSDEYQSSCRADTSVLRVSLVTTVFFLVQSLQSYVSRGSEGSGMAAKLFLYLISLLSTALIPSSVFDGHGYLQVSRFFGAVFVVLQQVILIDIAYNWNDAWVRKSDELENREFGAGKVSIDASMHLCIYLYFSFISFISFIT